jgi:hypothetical protein
VMLADAEDVEPGGFSGFGLLEQVREALLRCDAAADVRERVDAELHPATVAFTP